MRLNSNAYHTVSNWQNTQLEEYLIRRAENGKYSIHITLRSNAQHTITGVTTVLIYIYKYFGSDNEEKQIKTVRLTNLNETIDGGQIEFNYSSFGKRIRSTIQHSNIICDGCFKTPITGNRYRCMFCNNIDLCEDCHQLPSQGHDANHPFLCIRDSTLYASSITLGNMSAMIHPNSHCQLCSASPIVGIRYQCIPCQINLCEKCEFLCLHDISHQRLKVVLPS